MKGDNRRQRETRPLQSARSRPHQPTPTPHEGRQPETTGDKTTSEPKMAATPTNTRPPPTCRETTGDNGRQRETRPLQSPRSRPHQPTPTPYMKGDDRRQWETTRDNGRQRETRSLQSPRSRPHQPTPTPHMKGDNRRQRETRPLQSPRSRPHQPTPTPHEGRQPETTGDNGRQDHFRAQDGGHTNQHPPPHAGRQPETTGDNGRQDHFSAQEADHTNQHPPLT